MKRQNVRISMVIMLSFVLLGASLLAGCAARPRVGALRSESQSIELGDARSVNVEIDFGAGDLKVSGGAEQLMEADFTYNVGMLKPETKYKDNSLVVRQPDTKGWPDLRNITSYRNEWDLRFYDDVPMELSVNMGAGINNLQLADLSLTRLDVSQGAGESSIDLSGDWVRDLYVTIDAGAGNINIRLPRNVGVRVKVEAGLGTVDAADLTRHGNIYTNAAYGNSDVTLRINLEAGIGQITLEVVDEAAAQVGRLSVMDGHAQP